jgi:polyketide synthase PksN
MDTRDILTQFKNGTLPREQVAALLTGTPLTTVPEAPRHAPAGPAPTTAVPGDPLPVGFGAAAVTGLQVRLSQADGLQALWRAAMGRDGTAPAPRRGRFLRGVDTFDAAFFGLEPQEAAATDPQERLVLEAVWQTLESAGYAGARLDTLRVPGGPPRDVGVYVAHGPADHALLAAGDRDAAPGTAPTGCCGALPGRLSTRFDLRGPSHCVASGASSFLVALHLALSALRAGECAAALVAAVDLRLHPARHGADAGEGVGAVLLRPLAAALEAGDAVHAVVRAGAVAHPGRGTADDVETRLDHRMRAETGPDAAPGVLPETGAGAAAGVGDTGAVTGLAALARAVLQLTHGTRLPVPGGPAAVAWPRERDAQGRELPRRAAVTVHGESGTAARVLLEEHLPGPAPAPATDPAAAPASRAELILLSAPTPEHLAATARQLAGRLTPGPDTTDEIPPPAVLAAELALGRAALDCRLAVTVRSVAELSAALTEFADTPGTDRVQYADLRVHGTTGPVDGDLPETRAYLEALWEGRRLTALARLWLSGVDVTRGLDATRTARPAVPLPGTAMLRRRTGAARPPADGKHR